MTIYELCLNCKKTTKAVVVYHATGVEWLCSECGHQVDFLDNSDWEECHRSVFPESPLGGSL